MTEEEDRVDETSPVTSAAVPTKQVTSGPSFYFIHFAEAETCARFRTQYGGAIGHVCCSGKGCRLLDVTSWDAVHQLQREFEVPAAR